MTYEELRIALKEVQEARRAAEYHAGTIAELFLLSMRQANISTLRRIKRELRNFDMTRCTWKTP